MSGDDWQQLAQLLSFSSTTTYVNKVFLFTPGEVPPELLTPTVRPDQCFHCERDRHDGPLTEIVAAMWEQHKWGENYNPDLDYSPIVCPGMGDCAICAGMASITAEDET